MASIYKVILTTEGCFVPTVESDEEGWMYTLCKHRHHSEREAQKCLVRAMPGYMRHARRRANREGNL